MKKIANKYEKPEILGFASDKATILKNENTVPTEDPSGDGDPTHTSEGWIDVDD